LVFRENDSDPPCSHILLELLLGIHRQCLTDPRNGENASFADVTATLRCMRDFISKPSVCWLRLPNPYHQNKGKGVRVEKKLIVPLASYPGFCRPKWDDFIARLSSRVINALRKYRISSWEELLSTEMIQRYGMGTKAYVVQPGNWRSFGNTSFTVLVAAMESVGINPPSHWKKKGIPLAC
jgi:hypothetical protein